MRQIIPIVVVLLSTASMVTCGTPLASSETSGDVAGPSIEHIQTSTKVMAKSDCSITSVTVTADIRDDSGIKGATLWHRVGADQAYTPVNMKPADSEYNVTVKAVDVPGGKYGVWEFYIAAEDNLGNKSQSSLDTSVQLLACVGNELEGQIVF